MKALVTGGGGFLGSAIVRKLLARGDQVVSLARQDYPELRELGATTVRGDLGDESAVREAARGVDVIFHVAAKAGIWGDPNDYYRSNVLGTEHVLAAAQSAGIRRVVYTSSPSVIFNGRDMEGADESVPYPAHYEADYPRTKALAERAVLAANSEPMATVALRPHLIWGPGDHHVIPRLLARARAGQLRRIGKGGKRIDGIFVDNAADAHLLAADRLAPSSTIAGKAYFLTQGEPIETWDFINRILVAAGIAPVTRSIPLPVALAAAVAFETAHRVFRLPGEPRLTRFLVKELATSHWFDLTAARRDLGYAPAISLDEGIRRMTPWLRGQ